MVKKNEKTTAGKSAKKSKKGDESLEKEMNLKSSASVDSDPMDSSDEDLLLIEDDEFVASTEEMDEDVEFLMNAVVDGKGPKSADESAMSAAELAHHDNTKSAFEGITASSLKNFRHHPDIENFYRFVFDNDLRIEALSILDENIAAKKIKKALKDKKEKVH